MFCLLVVNKKQLRRREETNLGVSVVDTIHQTKTVLCTLFWGHFLSHAPGSTQLLEGNIQPCFALLASLELANLPTDSSSKLDDKLL
mmetsp:Transcript_2327/g.5388  ORF Transcript_2327/g.5388 Transcript_2327/m.5388 type:complete len:87 (+) Transcript_2327:280-540(+)